MEEDKNVKKSEKVNNQKEEKEIKQKKNEKKEENQENESRMGFFKSVWNSITKIEKYPDMAAQGFGKAMSYLAKIVAILAIVLCLGMIYQTHNLIKEGVNYLQNEFPEFSYNDEKLNIESENPIKISEEDSIAGYTIIDTKTEDEQEINKYINDVEKVGSGIIVLKDKVILKNSAVAGTINYEYKDIFRQMGITQFTKQDVVNYANSSQIINLYVSVFLTIFIYSFIMYMLTTLSNAVFLSAFGWITTIIAKIKMRFVAIFNMAVYSLTLSTILNMIYIAINAFIDFNIEYFQVMYISVAAIYLVAAIFILKSEFIKKQAELMKIIEAQEIVKKEMEQKKEEEKDADKEDDKLKEKEKEKEKKKEDKENKNKEDKDNNMGQEPEGSNA